MTFQASLHEKATTVVFPIETIPACFFSKEKLHQPKNLTKQETHQPKNLTNQKTSPNQKKPHHIPTPFRGSKKPRDFNLTNHLCFSTFLRLWCSYQGKDVDYRRPRSKAMEKTQGRTSEGLWLTAQLLIFFGNGKKNISFKETARMLISI